MKFEYEKNTLKRADISARFNAAKDLEGRYSEILQDISNQTHFVPHPTPFKKITWWGTKVGSVLYRGILPLKGHPTPAVLKIEGVKMEEDEASEEKMILAATAALKGSGIRPPKIYQEIPWTQNEGGYSGVFMEDVQGKHVLSLPGTKEQITELLSIRDTYRTALGKHTPWIEPTIGENEKYLSHFIKEKFHEWIKTRNNLFPYHPFRQKKDDVLIQQAVETLSSEYQGIYAEFQQGHFSHRDVVRVGEEIILFSNLYWAWRAPLYDMVFPYHWYMLDLANVPGMTIEIWKQHQKMWTDTFADITNNFSFHDKHLFSLARLERLAAGLNLDALSVSSDKQNKVAEYVVASIREELTMFLTKLR